MSFAWIFAMIVGAAILFLALFFAMNIISGGEYEVTTKTAQSIVNTFDALLTRQESIKTTSVGLAKDTRIYVSCSEAGSFGENRVAISEKSSFGGDWTNIGGAVPTQSQYIFSENVIEGNKMYFVVMPFEMPFKVADIMIVHTQQYCFVSLPDEIKRDIEKMIINQSEEKNMVIADSIEECGDESVNVCFANERGCDVIVEGTCRGGFFCDSVYDTGVITKNNERLTYVGRQLLYAAVFSDKENYECNVKRFMKRLDKLGDIYIRKINFLADTCGSNMQMEIAELKAEARNFEDLGDLIAIKQKADLLEESNRICEVY